jgi:D-alanyl-D-alanine dipeptidase
MLKFFRLFVCLAFLALPITVKAAPYEAEPLTKDEAALLGVYTGNGKVIVVGEAGQNLRIMNGYIPNVKDNEQGTIYSLTREHYNAYVYKDAGPNKDQDGNADFERDKNGQGISLRLDGSIYTRKFSDGENGKTFRITPPKPMAELRKEAAAAAVPKHNYSRTADLVDLATVVPGLHFDLRYTTSNNLFGSPLVLSKKAYLDKNAAQALSRVQKDLAPYGYGLVIWEAYRSWADFKLATLALGQKYKNYLPSAEKGFSHNTGRSVAVSLYELSTGEQVPMICDFDAVSTAQYSDYPGGTELQRWQRDLLREQMTKEGFEASKMEWWHFDYDHKTKYQLLNISEP